MKAAYWTGDEWRWRLKGSGTRPTIAVIEPAEQRLEPEHARRVAFGFARVLDEPASPDGWDGYAAMLAGAA